jgi:cell wall-associated NlpC family hydrolase
MAGSKPKLLAALALMPFLASGACRQGEQQPVHTGAGGGMELWLCVGRGQGPGENADATIGFDEAARLGVAVRRGGVLYSDFDALIIDGKRFDKDALKPMRDLPGWQRILWYKVESGRKSYMNTKKNPGWWADVAYVESLENSGRQTLRDVDVSPLLRKGVTWKGRAVGTMRYRAAVEFPGFSLSTPGATSPSKGGACPGLRRVSRQGGTGISAVDHAMSLANLPYIWGSAFLTGEGAGGKHQAELFVGADCADLVIAAWHMSGASAIPYRAVVPLLNAYGGTPFAVAVSYKKNGFYFGAPGKAITVGAGTVRPGAAVLWKFGPGGAKGHAAMLVADDGPDGVPNGVLDESDWVLHTRWDTPALARIKDTLPGIAPVAVLGPVPAAPEAP